MSQTLTILHPGLEEAADDASRPRLAPRPKSLAGLRLALLDNGKVNAGAILAAVGARLRARHGVAEVRAWKKRHAGESGAAVLPDVVRWKPDVALTALGD